MLCWHHLEICNKFWTRGSALSFALGPANFVDSLAKCLCLLGAEGLSILLHLLITQPCSEQWDGRDLRYSLRHVGFLFALYSNFSITFFTTGQFSKVLNMPKLSRKSCTAEESTNIAFWKMPSQQTFLWLKWGLLPIISPNLTGHLQSEDPQQGDQMCLYPFLHQQEQ